MLSDAVDCQHTNIIREIGVISPAFGGIYHTHKSKTGEGKKSPPALLPPPTKAKDAGFSAYAPFHYPGPARREASAITN